MREPKSDDPRRSTPATSDAARWPGAADGRFLTTRWSLVVSAAGDGEGARRSLEELASAYWYPLYAYARRRGRSAEDALDLTQGFFLALLERKDLAVADPRRGRFRSFLLTSMQHFMANEWDRGQAAKRGGGRLPLSIDAGEAEGRFGAELRVDEDPERLFERSWALATLERALARVSDEYRQRGKGALFQRLRSELSPAGRESSTAELARDLELGEGAVRVALHRLRGRFREALRSEVADTLGSSEGVDEELGELMRALRGK